MQSEQADQSELFQLTGCNTWLSFWVTCTTVCRQQRRGNRQQSCHSCQAEASSILNMAVSNKKKKEKNRGGKGILHIYAESVNPAHLAQIKTQPQFSRSNKVPFCHVSPNHDRKVVKTPEPPLQSPHLI